MQHVILVEKKGTTSVFADKVRQCKVLRRRRSKVSEVIEGLEGVICHIDDVWGHDQKEHDARLHATLQRLENAGMILNGEKCCVQFYLFSIRGQQQLSSNRCGTLTGNSLGFCSLADVQLV